MAQKINLNASPYYDDFDPEKNFHRVLYKPGFPVQARELTSQQTILQNQIEKFGNHVFKDGSVVIPGGIAFDNRYNSVKLNSTNFNIDVSIYIKNFIGKRIRGSESGIEAIVKAVSLPDQIDVTDITLHVTYLTANTDGEIKPFNDGEILTANENVVYGNTTINANTPFASLVSSDATAVGSAAFISDGVYFVRGFFVNVKKQTIVLDFYNNIPSYRVGLQVNELIVNAKEDSSLFDNAKGFSNFAAPGADRLKIELILTKKLITDKNDTDFIELLRLDQGKIKIMEPKSDYNIILDEMARRTFDESGDYSVDPFQFKLFNSLNNNLGNNGLFFDDGTTEQGNTPSDDLACLKVSKGTAYIRGYEVQKDGTSIIDVEKPRDVGIRSDVGIGFEMGNLIRLNNVKQGIANQGSIIKLFDDFGGAGKNIGSARVYSFNLEDSAYEDDKTAWELRLFDIQTNTDLVLNKSITDAELPAGSFVKGRSSGASGFAVGAGGGEPVIALNQTSGSFVKGEQLEINGVAFPRTIGIATAYTALNLKSVGDGSKFKGDVILDSFRLPNGVVNANITGTGFAADATVTAGARVFTGLSEGMTIRYVQPVSSGINTETYNRIKSISSDGSSMVLTAHAGVGVTGVYDTKTPASGSQNVDIFIGAPTILGSGTLFTPLSNDNIANVDLTESNLKITKKITGKSLTGNSLVLSVANDVSDVSDVIFDTFDQERYSVFNNSDGKPQTIADRGFEYNNQGADIRIFGATTNQNFDGGTKDITVTLTKTKVKSKLKQYNRSHKELITRSRNSQSGSVSAGNGASLADGLTFDARYGLRVQDEEISLNYPDVVKVLAIYESTDTSAPTLDKLSFASTVNVELNAVIGENIVGQDGNVIARVVSKPSANVLEVVYLTSGKFIVGERVVFEESNIDTSISTITIGLYKDITTLFSLDKGQKNQYYDYSRLVRNPLAAEPSRQLLVVFDYYSVPANDNGDIFTVRSYDADRFATDIPTIGPSGIRATDTFDFRPRVSVYNPASDTGSPFEFGRRDFSGTSILRYITPNENSISSYEFYLPRVDRIYLNKFEDIVYEKGVPSENPQPPTLVSEQSELMQLATVSLPAYLYNPQDALIQYQENRRYTMRDISNIADRVSELEQTTTLSLLEVDAQLLQVQDEEGRSRFKSGFFVDPFKNTNFINSNLSSIQINPTAEELMPFRSRDTLASQLTPAESILSSELDFNTDFELFDSNVKKTGNIVSLNYEEVEWITQVYATKSGEFVDVVNVNPYELPVFNGNIELDPPSDVWTRTVQLADRTVRQTGTRTLRDTFLGNFVWGQDINPGDIAGIDFGLNDWTDVGNGNLVWETGTTTSERVETQNNLVSSAADDFMRSRNIQFECGGFLDFVRTYLFIDGQKIFDIIPKLLEITPTANGTDYGSNGAFKIGEEVRALDGAGNVIMKFRACQPDHKTGAYNNPIEVYLNNPYTNGVDKIPSNYSQSSTVLNVDTKALSEEAQGNYFGYVSKNSQLVGQESGATAFVKDLRLITDAYGELIGSCFLRDPHAQPSPPVKIAAGTQEFKVTTSPVNELPTEFVGELRREGITGEIISGETLYTAIGTVETWQNTVNIFTDTVVNRLTARVRSGHCDPLAQTFVVGGNVAAPNNESGNGDFNGAFITSVEVYFATVDTVTNSPIRCEIRSTVADARPSRDVLGRSRTLRPKGTDADGNEVQLIEADSLAASKPTKFTFPEPIYLAPGISYAFVLIAPQSTAYTVWTGKLGGIAVNANTITGADSGSSLFYNRQYGMGAIFKSQNGALWTEDQTQDITFKLYKAKFTSNAGSVFFNNPDLSDSNGYETTLRSNPILSLPKTGFIGVTTNTDLTVNQKLAPGRKIWGNKNTSTAIIAGVGASAIGSGSGGSLEILDAGIDYTSKNPVSTFAISGQGSGLTLNMTAGGGQVTSALPVNGGSGYRAGDVVGIVTSSSDNKGHGAVLTVGSINGFDTLYLTNIQADETSFAVGESYKYFDDDGTTLVTMGSTGEIRSLNYNGGANSGNVFRVDQFNHGMYSDTNRVKIENIGSDVTPTVLTAALSKTETSVISVASTADFTTFEGLSVGVGSTGYVKIGSEIIGYDSVGNNTLNLTNTVNNSRGVDNTVVTEHLINSVVRKHEFSGVSIRRLEVASVSGIGITEPIGLDDYHVVFDRSTNGKDRSVDTATEPQLSFNSASFAGGSNVRATQNILYGALVPRYDIFTPVGIDGSITRADASIRTVTGTSIDGNEGSFVDNGYENVQLNTYNSLDTVRLVSSKVNEDQYLTSLPSNKSFTTKIDFSTNNENISPIIRLSSGSETEFINHRLNSPVALDSFNLDVRPNRIVGDPHAAIYVSNPIRLSKPATSLKVLLTAFRPASSDFRVLYILDRADSDEVAQEFELFPGFLSSTKTDSEGFIVNDGSKNDGRPDSLVTPSTQRDQFKEYQFTADNLPEFLGFSIKIIMAGTNQAQPPRIKELRAIAVK